MTTTQGTPPADPKGTWIGVWISVALLALSVLACLVTGAVAALESETSAMQVAHVTVPFVVAGLTPWIAALLTRRQSTGIAVGVPVGCGCVSWIMGAIGTFVFFAFVWESL